MSLLTKQQSDRFNRLISEFLWIGRKSKLSLSILQNDKKKGGLKLCTIIEKQKSIQLQWIKMIEKDNSYVYQLLIPDIGKNIWKCNLNEKDCHTLIPVESFWRNILIQWAEMHCYEPQTCDEIMEQIVWYNSFICIQDRVISKSEGCGIIYIADLVNNEYEFIDYNQFCEKFHCKLHWLRYAQLIASIPEYWKLLLGTKDNSLVSNRLITYEEICNTRKTCTFIYNLKLEKNHASI